MTKDLMKQKKVIKKGRTLFLVSNSQWLYNKQQLHDYLFFEKKFVLLKKLREMYVYSYGILNRHLNEKGYFVRVVGGVIHRKHFDEYLSNMPYFKCVRAISKDLGLGYSKTWSMLNLLESYVSNGLLKKSGTDNNPMYYGIKEKFEEKLKTFPDYRH